MAKAQISFQPTVTYAVPHTSHAVKLADLNRDGFADLVYAISNRIIIRSGSAAGTLGNPIELSGAGFRLEVGDLNGDGWMDIVASDSQYPQLRKWLGGPAFEFTELPPSGMSRGAGSIAIGELTRDGITDLATGHGHGNGGGYCALRPGVGDGSFLGTRIDNGDTFAVRIGDVTSDGFNEIIAYSDPHFRTYTYVDPLTFTVLATTPGFYPQTFEVADVNNDGHLDVIGVLSQDVTTQIMKIVVMLGAGNGTFYQDSFIEFPLTQYATLAIGDLNGDGVNDLMVGRLTGGLFSLLGTTDGHFIERTGYSSTPAGPNVALGDINGDGKLDAAITDTQGNAFGILINNSPDPSVHVVSYTVQSGEEFAGTVGSLRNRDGDALSVFPDPDSLVGAIEFEGQADITGPPQVTTLGVSASCARTGLVQRVDAWNFTTGAWNQMDGRVAPTTALFFRIFFPDGGRSYIAASGELRARIIWEPIADEDPSMDGWLQSVDYLAWAVTP